MNTVILPVKDEPGLNTFTQSLYEILEEMGQPFEILVIMGDREQLHPEISRRPNLYTYKGYADSLERAILLGFSVSKGDKLLVMDADGSHPIETIPEMLGKLDNCDMVIGSRFLPGSDFSQSAFRKLVSHFFIWWAHLWGSKLTDPMSGLFTIRRTLLDGIKFKPIKWKTCLEIELKTQPQVCEIPIHFKKRVSGASKTTLMTGLRLIYDLVTL